ncbi:G protein-coupled glucose receptor regulating Gpa2-domain-containing protein [Cyathus striatus]|nr:G protein-coupled glucose receptor regulating Gpa2-domain-containing protein [Cyathus striatus]
MHPYVTGLPIVIAALNLVGSLSSFIGSAFIIVTYVILPTKCHFRHVLILNLATSDCLNALNQCISSLYILITRQGLSTGSACVANGFIGQFTVQATDCSILAIAIATVFTITQFKLQTTDVIWSTRTIIVVTVGVWIIPVITSLIALVKGWYAPATGSWCWIVENPGYIRYALNHGWRFSFIFIEVVLYIYLYAFLTKHYRYLSKAVDSPKAYSREEPVLDPRHRSVQRILLLNAYPLAYIILWIPGIANRLVELSGHTSRITQVLQASTQFVGLANALTYGWNESIAKQLYRKLDLDSNSDSERPV